MKTCLHQYHFHLWLVRGCRFPFSFNENNCSNRVLELSPRQLAEALIYLSIKIYRAHKKINNLSKASNSNITENIIIIQSSIAMFIVDFPTSTKSQKTHT